MTDPVRLVIERLGTRGDGIATHGGQSVFVPFALAGETVAANITSDRALLVDVVAESQDRRAPVCRHFTSCGGCALQHFETHAYLSWKRDLVVNALLQRGIETQVHACVGVGEHDRRRAVFSAVKQRGEVKLGYFGARTHEIVAIEDCPVLRRDIVATLPLLQGLCEILCKPDHELRLTITRAENGIDVAVGGHCHKLDAPRLCAIGNLAHSAAANLSICRISCDGEPLFVSSTPEMVHGRARIVLPPGAFVQASADAETRIGDLVMAAVPKKAKRAVDLFCGLGAFAFRLAEKLSVLAVDSDAAAISALQLGAKRTAGLRPIDVKVRDLMREPLSRLELKDCDFAVFDPPRAGADEQAKMLAKARVPTVIAVSCNPATLARDLRTLIDAGYRTDAVTPIDQFLYSAHVEAVAVLRYTGA